MLSKLRACAVGVQPSITVVNQRLAFDSKLSLDRRVAPPESGNIAFQMLSHAATQFHIVSQR